MGLHGVLWNFLDILRHTFSFVTSCIVVGIYYYYYEEANG